MGIEDANDILPNDVKQFYQICSGAELFTDE